LAKLLTAFMASLLLAASAPCIGSPAPAVDFGYEYYPVTGATTDEINASIQVQTPIVAGGRKYGAVTRNDFWTNYARVDSPSGGCEVRNVRVKLRTRIVLPSLQPGRRSAAVQAEWGRYIRALHEHEMMHAQNGARTAQTVISRLFRFKSDLSCNEMGPMLDAAVNQLISNISVWDMRFDSETQHGATHGAVLRGGIR